MRAIVEDDQSILRKVGDVVDVVGKVGGFGWKSEVLDANTRYSLISLFCFRA